MYCTISKKQTLLFGREDTMITRVNQFQAVHYSLSPIRFTFSQLPGS
jgi:hypothetical protein